MIYGQGNTFPVPNQDLLTFLFDSEHCTAKDDTPIHAEAEDPTNSTLTKSQARLLTTQVAHFLRTRYDIGSAGPGGDVVLTVSSGQSRLPCVFFGVAAAGGIYAAASPSSTPAALARLAREAGPAKVLVCSRESRETAVSAAHEAGIPLARVLVLTSYPEFTLQSADGGARCDANPRDGVLQWTAVTDPEVLARTPVCLIYSSGTTTGAPKGVLLSHANMVAEAFLPSLINRRAWASRPPLNADDAPPLGQGYRTLAHLPPAHVSGVQGYFVNPLLDGGIVYWMPAPAGGGGFDMAAFLRYIESLRITSFFTAPPVYEAVAKCILYRPGLVGDKTLRSLRVAYSGGTRLRLGAAAGALRGRMGDPEGGRPLHISQTFGATESTGAATHMPPDRAGWDTLDSVGELLPNMWMRLVDDEDRDVPVGMPGEALLKGPVVMMGYHNNPEANAAVFTPDGWFRTGDVLKVEDGLVYYVDRKQVCL
ncbi:putative 4-coumarateligase [Diaporthe ampelina]|uniref:Putative 4-coumarateligase n=1 Tax=Diaporthe ampelina TaxID=1214573 RepID=A0A0G2G133_9PEZI|nr:putative 4-coumarateligase [Diaporthe ampelina]